MACGELGAVEWSAAKYGHAQDDRPLPPAAGRLTTVCGWRSGGRGEELWRCARCGAWFHWVLSYEFLVGGSEDEETLTRVSAEEAAVLRGRLGG